MHVPIRRVEAFLRDDGEPFANRRDCRGASTLTGRTIRSGFPCAPPAPSPLAALRIMSRACFRFAALSAPIWPSWISVRLNGLNAGAGGTVDMNATLLRVTSNRARPESERRENVFERTCRQQSICDSKARQRASITVVTYSIYRTFPGGRVPYNVVPRRR